MPVEGIKKAPGATRGVDLPLITNEEFAKWLIKEFKIGWKEANDKALHYPQDRKEVALLLKDWMPAISLKGIDHLMKPNFPYIFDYISSDLRILEKYGMNPSVAILKVSPVTLERNIQALMEHKRKLNEYARMRKLSMEPEKFKSYLDNVEGGVIKKLHEKMPKIPIDAVEEFVNKTNLRYAKSKIKALEDRGVDISAFTDINEFSSAKLHSRFERREEHKKEHLEELKRGLQAESPEAVEKFVKESRGNVITHKLNALKAWGIKLSEVGSLERFNSRIGRIVSHVERQRFIDYLGAETQIPHGDIEKVVDEVQPGLLCMRVNALAEEGKLKGLTDANVLRMSLTDLRAGMLAPEPSKVLAIKFRDGDEKRFLKRIGTFPTYKREAFMEIGKVIREKGRITQDEMEEVFGRHMAGDKEEIRRRLNKDVNLLVGGRNLDIEFIEKAE
jgi:hypothetical protein